jgi:hypothetical protein
MKNKTLLMLSSSLELATGLIIVADPSLVARVLLSTGLNPAGEAVGRIGGFGLLTLAISCWPRGETDQPQPIRALLLYNLLAAIYLGYLKIGGEFSSHLLLPASALHGLLALLFVRPAYVSVRGEDPKTFEKS